MPPDPLESAIAIALDSIYNLAVTRAGYAISTVVAASASVQSAQLPPTLHPEGAGPHPPRGDLCYPTTTGVFVLDHLKFLTGMGRDPGGVASRNVMALCEALQHFYDGHCQAGELYEDVRASEYYKPRIVPLEAFTTKKSLKREVKAMASGLASINGTVFQEKRGYLFCKSTHPYSVVPVVQPPSAPSATAYVLRSRTVM